MAVAPTLTADDQLAQWTSWALSSARRRRCGPGLSSIDLALAGEILDLEFAALAAQSSQTEAVRTRCEAQQRDHPDRAFCGLRTTDEARFTRREPVNKPCYS